MDKLLDERCREILVDVFQQTLGSLDNVNIRRYRIEHIDDVERIESLMRKNLLYVEYANDTLRVGAAGLYFIRNAARDALLTDIDRIIDYLRKQYRENPDQPQAVRLTRMAEDLDIGLSRLEECLEYMRRILPYEGTGNLREPYAYTIPTEALFHFGKFEEVLAEHARQWCPEAAEAKQAIAKPHDNSVAHATTREQVLGAAITALVHWPDACKRDDAFNANRIASLIDQKALLWWAHGEAPLSTEIMARLINHYLKLSE